MLGLIGPVNTRMYLAQAAGSSPIVNAFQAGTLHVNPVEPNTIAKSLAIGNPADGYYALKIVSQSGGDACAATDEEAIAGMKLLAQTEGIFTEAAGGVVIGVLKKLATSGAIKKNDLTVTYITGAGPRTQETVADIVKPYTIQPSVESFEEVLGTPV